MSLPNTSTDSVMLDVRDRLARIEVKIDATNDKLKDHDVRLGRISSDVEVLQAKAVAYETANLPARINDNSLDIDNLKSEVAAYKTKVATCAKIGGAVAAVAGLFGWVLDHATVITAVATSVPH